MKNFSRQKPSLPAFSARNSRLFSLIELLVVIAIIAILAALLLPVLDKARSKARVNICMNVLRQTGQAFAQYEGDYNDFCPPTKGDSPKPADTTGIAGTTYKLEWYDLVLPYVSAVMHEMTYKDGANSKIYTFLVCPLSRGCFDAGERTADLYGSYGYNHRFSAQKITRFKHLSRSGMAMDSEYYFFHNYHNNTLEYITHYAHFRPRSPLGSSNILMGDGHVESKQLREFLGYGPYGTSDSGYRLKYNVTLDPTKDK